METIQKQDQYLEHELHNTYNKDCSTCWGENLKTEPDISFKCNGLHSGTKFEVFKLDRGVTQEWHEHPDTGELVIINTWYVMNGEDDVDSDFEVVKVYPKVACELAKLNKGHNINKPIK